MAQGEIRNAGALERLIGSPRFQRPFAAIAAVTGICFLAVALSLLAGGATRLHPAGTIEGIAQRFETGMRLALILVAAVLALYLALRSQRMPLPRLLSAACGALAAGLALFLAMRLHLETLPDADLARQSMTLPWVWRLVGVLAVTVVLMSVWLFSAMKFLFYFPKPVKLMGHDPAEADREGHVRFRKDFDWRWFATPQFAALATGWILILAVGLQAERLKSAIWEDATIYMVCWAPFAFLGAKQRHLDDEGRRAVRWVVLGQAIWLVVFVLALAAVIALRATGTLAFADWTASERFTSALLLGLMEGFVVLFLATLAISILYHGTLDPDLMIRRTWVLGAVGLISGVLFVLAERALATLVAGWVGLSSLDALTIVAILTAVLLVPLRARVERFVRRTVERWQSAFAIADGRRQMACIVFADLSGYTALTERDERAAITLAAVFHRAAGNVAESHGGRLIKTIGDAVLLRLPTPDQAVAAVRALSEAYHARAAHLRLAALPVHTAIHRGEVVESSDGDVFGATVNLAARLLGAAGPNEVVASASALEGLSPQVRHQSMGDRQFKNVDQPVACFRLAL